MSIERTQWDEYRKFQDFNLQKELLSRYGGIETD
jgi:hypothetical protein